MPSALTADAAEASVSVPSVACASAVAKASELDPALTGAGVGEGATTRAVRSRLAISEVISPMR